MLLKCLKIKCLKIKCFLAANNVPFYYSWHILSIQVHKIFVDRYYCPSVRLSRLSLYVTTASTSDGRIEWGLGTMWAKPTTMAHYLGPVLPMTVEGVYT